MPLGLENVGQDKTERRVRPDFVLHCVLCFRGTQQGSEMQQAGDASKVTAPGVTRFHETLVQRDMEFLRVLKRALSQLRTPYPRNHPQRTRLQPPADRAWGHSGRGHYPANLQARRGPKHPPKYLSIRQWQKPWKPLFFKCCSKPTQKLHTKCNLILKTHNR